MIIYVLLVLIESENEETIIYAAPNDLYKIKEAISKKLPNVEFDMDEITYLPKDKIKLVGEDLDTFKRMLDLLDEVEDVQNVYHNVEL